MSPPVRVLEDVCVRLVRACATGEGRGARGELVSQLVCARMDVRVCVH